MFATQNVHNIPLHNRSKGINLADDVVYLSIKLLLQILEILLRIQAGFHMVDTAEVVTLQLDDTEKQRFIILRAVARTVKRRGDTLSKQLGTNAADVTL